MPTALPTRFAAPISKLLPLAAMTSVLALTPLPAVLSAAPFMVVAWRTARAIPEEPSYSRVVKALVVALFWVTPPVLTLYALLKVLLNVPFTGFHCLAAYAPVFLLISHISGDAEQPYGFAGQRIMQFFFDMPLTAAGFVLRELLGLRLFSPFASIIDDVIVQGSLPFPSDVRVLAEPPYNVGAVVNMCREWSGPVQEYDKHDIRQLRLPTQDTLPPSLSSLKQGVDFIAEQRRLRPQKRVYIHCKGGIARASTMSLAHFIWNKGMDPEVAVNDMKRKRAVVLTEVKDYSCIKALLAEYRGSADTRAEEELKAA